jgi:glycosyltransferase involved in cell wall biosynthesis
MTYSTRPMKILFLSHTSRLGGAELALARYLERGSDIDRELLVLERGPLAERARHAGIPTTVLAGDGRVKAIAFWRTVLRAWWRLYRTEHDAIVANGINAVILLSTVPKARRRYICYLRENVGRDRHRRMKHVLLTRYVLPRCDVFFANSHWTASTLPPTVRTRPTEIVYTMSGVTSATTAQQRAEPSPNRLRVLSLSRLVPEKGVHILVQALAYLSGRGYRDRLTATVAGDDLFEDSRTYAKALRTSAATLDGMVEFVGQVDDVGNLLAQHDILVCCSTQPEGLGQVIVQAMSHGLAVISTDHGGPRELVNHGATGLLVPPADPIALADAIEMLLTSPETQKTICAAAIPASAAFSDERMAELFEAAVVRSLADARGERRAGATPPPPSSQRV